MHPLVKIICIIVISIFVGISNWSGILLTAAIILPIYFRHSNYYASAWRMVKRLKWFYFSIFFVYLFFTPKTSLNNSTFGYLEGIDVGIYRVSVLILIVLSVNLLIRTSTKEDLLSGLYLIFSPFVLIGLNPQTFLARAYLTLDYIQILNSQLGEQKDFFSKRFSLPKLVSRLAEFVSTWIEKAQQKHTQPLSIKLLEYPKIWEWAIPIGLSLLYIYLPIQIDKLL